MSEYGWIYQMSWYESNRHTKSFTDMYFAQEEHTHWLWDGVPRQSPPELCKIFYIRVKKSSKEYSSAVCNSSPVGTYVQEHRR
mgnify:CR=1 FL=1